MGRRRCRTDRRRALAASVLAALLMCACAAVPASARRPQAKRHARLSISVLSNRADLISGGDALVAINLPKRVKPSSVRVRLSRKARRKRHGRKLHGRSITSAFAVRSDGHYEGLVTGLPLGRSFLQATARLRHRRIGARIPITNHPIGGPVFAGPQIQPWTCQQGATTRSATSRRSSSSSTCPRAPRPTGAALPGTNSNGRRRLVPALRPEEPAAGGPIATTTTDRRRDRAVHRPARDRLHRPRPVRDRGAVRPGQAVDARPAPQRQFNHRLVITHGFSCDTEYKTGERAERARAEGAGRRVHRRCRTRSTTPATTATSLTQAESLVMTKEYAIDHYGTVRWTIGSGCSGGSLVQQQVANAYPGVYQGITPQCSFTDAWSSAMQYEEYYFGLQVPRGPDALGSGRGLRPGRDDRVLRPPEPRQPGHVHDGDPELGQPVAVLPRRAGRPGLQRADQPARACAARCRTTWSTRSAATRDGFARRGFDNVGVQYGLKGLRAGPDLAGAVRRLQHPHRRRRHRPQHHAGSAPRPTRSRSSASTGPARSTRPTTSTRSRSSTCAGPIPAPSTTSTAPTRCGRG